MKALKCEMCGMNQLVKKDGMYVCEYCGTQYTVEEARKLMVEIEGTVDVRGTVQLDNSEKLSKLYQVARRAKEDNNSENAAKYYDMTLQEDPESWEAQFYTVYYQAMSCKIANIYSAAVSITNCEDTVFNLIKENVQAPSERKKAVDEVAAKLITIAGMLFNGAKRHYDGIGYQIQANYTQEMLNRCCAARDILYTSGNLIVQLFGEEYGKDFAAPCWEVGIRQHALLIRYFKDKEGNKNLIMSYVDKIKNFKEDYQAPEIKTGGCYVATCVYGSYDCPEVWTLRRYRDDTLGATWYGRAFIRTYYAISPTLVKWFGHTNWFKKMWRGKLDRMVTKLQNKGVENTPYDDKDWRK
jgi:uncharacterized Zn finger protein (UPF0148 family)